MIGWRDGAGELHRGSLFGAFAALARGEAWSFPALRPHQREPWHAFTVQVAALALIRAGVGEPPGEEEAWRDLLLALTPEHPGGEAWALVVDDWSKPALLQPPVVSAGNKADYKNPLPTPDALDMLVTARNHDLKQEVMVDADEQDWLFALVTLQTGEGYGGAYNFGISRMNGGQSNRMALGITWANHAAERAGIAYADRDMAAAQSLDLATPWRDLVFPEDGEKVATRLGARDLLVDFDPPLTGPFGEDVHRVTIPHWMAGGVGPDDRPALAGADDHGQRFRLGERTYSYGRWGLAPAA